MPSPKVLIFSLFLAVMPIGIVIALNHEQIADSMVIEASEVNGKLLFFTAPSR